MWRSRLERAGSLICTVDTHAAIIASIFGLIDPTKGSRGEKGEENITIFLKRQTEENEANKVFQQKKNKKQTWAPSHPRHVYWWSSNYTLCCFQTFWRKWRRLAAPPVLSYRPSEPGETPEVRVTCVSTNHGKSNHLWDGCVYSDPLLIRAWQFNDE